MNSKPRIQDFFTRANRVSGIAEDDYRQAASIVNTAKAVSRSISQSVYIIDYFMQDFLWVSDSLAMLCGETPGRIQQEGYRLYIDHVPEEEQRMLLEINEKGFEFFNSLPNAERTEYTISYDFHIANGRKLSLVNHKITPLVMTADGRIWLALCTVAPSAHRTPGHIVIRKTGAKTRHEYNLKEHRWEEKPEISLNELETSILKLASQGFSMQEIADRTFRSLDAIRSCKRRLFSRLAVKSITEALTFAANNRLM